RVQRRALRDRTALQYPAHLQAEVVVQPARVVLLNHKTPPRGTRRGLAGGLRRLVEVALLAVGLQGHGLAPGGFTTVLPCLCRRGNRYRTPVCTPAPLAAPLGR